MVMIMIKIAMMTSPPIPPLYRRRVVARGETRGGADGGGEQFLFSFPTPPLFSPHFPRRLGGVWWMGGENGKGLQFLPTLPPFWL